MSDPTRQEYYNKLHQTIADETGVDANIVQYLRSALGKGTKEGLKKYLERRITLMNTNLSNMKRHLTSKDQKRKKKFASYEEQIAGTEKGLEFRRKILEVLNTADDAKMASILREDAKKPQ